MKITKTASGKSKIKMSKKEWQNIGREAGWMKKAWQENLTPPDPHPEKVLDDQIEEMKREMDDCEKCYGRSPLCKSCDELNDEINELKRKYSDYHS